jgi:Spy/CpxP family protein refolding chaperone
MKKTLVALGLVAVMFLGISYVYARGPGFGPGPGHVRGPGAGPGNCPGCGGGLNLTTEQQTQMKLLQENHYKEVAPLREEMANLRQELRTLWANPQAQAGDIQSKAKEMNVRMNELRDQMQDKMIQHRLEIRKLLTPEQISAMGAGPGKGGRGMKGFGPGRGRN